MKRFAIILILNLIVTLAFDIVFVFLIVMALPHNDPIVILGIFGIIAMFLFQLPCCYELNKIYKSPRAGSKGRECSSQRRGEKAGEISLK